MTAIATRQVPIIAMLLTAIALAALNLDGVHRRVLPGYIVTAYLAGPKSAKNEAIGSRSEPKRELGWPLGFAEGYGALGQWRTYAVNRPALLFDLVFCFLLTATTYVGAVRLVQARARGQGFNVRDLLALTAAIAIIISAPGVLYPRELYLQVPCTAVIAGSIVISATPILQFFHSKRTKDQE